MHEAFIDRDNKLVDLKDIMDFGYLSEYVYPPIIAVRQVEVDCSGVSVQL